jgi:hypothetical protein
MYIAELLEVAAGLVFIWLGLALACMGMQEWIAGLLGFRAEGLEMAIRGMLAEPSKSAGAFRKIAEWISQRLKLGEEQEESQQPEGVGSLVERLYDHHLIKALSKPGRKPSYIPAHTFSLVLFDVVMTAGTDASTIQKALQTLRGSQSELPQLEDEVKEALDGLIASAAEAVEDETKLVGLKRQLYVLTEEYPQLKPTLDALLQTEMLTHAAQPMLKNLTRGVARLAVTNPALTQALGAMITNLEATVADPAAEAERTLAQLRTSTEMWFNDTMDRLTGWYKRKSQIIAVVLGVFFAILLNVDSVVIATELWREPTVRQALVAQAETFEMPEEIEAEDPAAAVEAFSARFAGLRIPLGWVPAEMEVGQRCTCLWWYPADQYVWGIPMGQECLVPVDAPEGGIPRDWGYILPKALGLLISGAAASQGAPFWFDVLKKLTNVRSAGKNPAEEKAK